MGNITERQNGSGHQRGVGVPEHYIERVGKCSEILDYLGAERILQNFNGSVLKGKGWQNNKEEPIFKESNIPGESCWYANSSKTLVWLQEGKYRPRWSKRPYAFAVIACESPLFGFDPKLAVILKEFRTIMEDQELVQGIVTPKHLATRKGVFEKYLYYEPSMADIGHNGFVSGILRQNRLIENYLIENYTKHFLK